MGMTIDEVLDKIRAEIETKYGQCKLTEYIVQYDGICTSTNDIGDIADILQIIDKYKGSKEMSEKAIKALEHENIVLKNRCRVLGQGVLCIFCPMECENRAADYRGDDTTKEAADDQTDNSDPGI